MVRLDSKDNRWSNNIHRRLWPREQEKFLYGYRKSGTDKLFRRLDAVLDQLIKYEELQCSD